MLLRLEDPDSRVLLLRLCRCLARDMLTEGVDSPSIVELQDAFYDFGRSLDPTNPDAGALMALGDREPFPERVGVLWRGNARMLAARGLDRATRMLAELVELQASYLLLHEQVRAADAAQSFAAELRRYAARFRRDPAGRRTGADRGRDPADVRKRS